MANSHVCELTVGEGSDRCQHADHCPSAASSCGATAANSVQRSNSQQRQHHTGSSAQAQSSCRSSSDDGEAEAGDAWRRRKLATAKAAAPASKQPCSPDVHDAVADADSNKLQQHTAADMCRAGWKESPRVNGYSKVHHRAEQSCSYQAQHSQLGGLLQAIELPCSVEQHGWMSIQFGDLPPAHQLGSSPVGEPALFPVDVRRRSHDGVHWQRTSVVMPRIHCSSSTDLAIGGLDGAVSQQHSQFQRSCSFDGVNHLNTIVSVGTADPVQAAASVLQQPPAASCLKATALHQQHSLVPASNSSLVNGKHGIVLEEAVAAAVKAATQSSQQPGEVPKQQVGQVQHSELQHQQQQSCCDSAPSTPQSLVGGRADLLNGPGCAQQGTQLSPRLSPQLLKQFGLRVAPLNGSLLADELQLRQAIEQAGASAVLVARNSERHRQLRGSQTQPQQHQQVPREVGNGRSSSSSSQRSDAASSGSNGTPMAQLQQRAEPDTVVDSSIAAGRAAQHSRDNGLTSRSQASKQQQSLHVQHLQLHVQVPDCGVDDCSIASSTSSAHTSSTISNPWQQFESAAVALQLASGQHAPNGRVPAGYMPGHQQHMQPGHNSSPQLQHQVDQSEFMSDPGTVPESGLGVSEGLNGFSRLRPGRNRSAQLHTGSGGTGNRQMLEQSLVMHQAAGGGGNSRRGGASSSNSTRNQSGNDGASHRSGGDRGADRGGERGGRGGAGSRDGDSSSQSGGGGRRGGDRGTGRRNSRGSNSDFGLPKSPQMGGNRRSFDARGAYDERRGPGSSGRHTPVPSPGARSNQEYHRAGSQLSRSSSRHDVRDGASPHTTNPNSKLAGHPSPLLLPEPALASGPGSSKSAGMASIDLPPAAAAAMAAGLPATGPLTDLERFLAATGPSVPVDPAMPLQQVLESLTLKSVWDLFLEPSLWGTPVTTMGGPRGTSTAYYVPFMSAMQLFTTVADVGPAAAPPAPGNSTTSGNNSDSGSTVNSSSASPVSSSGTSTASSYAAAAAAGTQATDRSNSPSGAAAAAAAAAGSTPVGPGGRGGLYTCAVKGWPTVMRLLLEHMEQELPFSRDPFYIQLEAMTGGPEAVEAAVAAIAAAAAKAGSASAAATPAPSSSESVDAAAAAGAPSPATRLATPAVGGFTACGYPLVGPDLMSTRLMDVHPASWFAVAWYPVYRIPDAPLTARFLAFYSFSQLLEVLNDAVSAAKADLSAPCRLACLPMPVVGMKWYNLMGERWLELLGTSAQAAAAGSRRSRDAGRDSNAQNSAADGEQQLLRLQMHPQRFREWQSRLQDLQGVAERLSKGSGLKVLTPQGPKEVRLYHSDYEFFNSRG